MLPSDGKQQAQLFGSNGPNPRGEAMVNGENGGNETVHYFQTPYALSRLPQVSMDDGLLEALPTPPPPLCSANNCCAKLSQPNIGAPTANATLANQAQLGGTLGRPRMNGDHVYDMPFPPKWV